MSEWCLNHSTACFAVPLDVYSLLCWPTHSWLLCLPCVRRSTTTHHPSESESQTAISIGKAALVQLFTCSEHHGRRLLHIQPVKIQMWAGYDQLTIDLITEAADRADAACSTSGTPDKPTILAHSKQVQNMLRQYRNVVTHPICHRLFHLMAGQIKALSTNLR